MAQAFSVAVRGPVEARLQPESRQRGLLYPNSVLTPHQAAKPNAARKASPITRPEIVLLLQAWSTATSQTKNRAMPQSANIFKNMTPYYACARTPG